jgi:heme-degrading monooxygenase HmoA
MKSGVKDRGGTVIKILLERTIKGKNVVKIVQLLRQLRVLAMQQPGYIGGETLHAVEDPNHYLVISSWESLGHWQAWLNNPERQKLQAEVDSYLESPTSMRVFTY